MVVELLQQISSLMVILINLQGIAHVGSISMLLYMLKKKGITKQQAKEIESFKLTSPCFLDTIPHRERSKKRSKHNIVVSKLKKKLDNVAFDCYTENLWKSFSEDKKTSFTYRDSLWFTMHAEAPSGAKVPKWIKGKRIFSKSYCSYRSCSLSENITSCMLFLDSLEMANPQRLEPVIRKFAWDIYKSEGRPENKHMICQIPLLVPEAPQQRNNVHCGNYVLYFITVSFYQVVVKKKKKMSQACCCQIKSSTTMKFELHFS